MRGDITLLICVVVWFVGAAVDVLTSYRYVGLVIQGIAALSGFTSVLFYMEKEGSQEVSEE